MTCEQREQEIQKYVTENLKDVQPITTEQRRTEELSIQGINQKKQDHRHLQTKYNSLQNFKLARYYSQKANELEQQALQRFLVLVQTPTIC